jgi:hypothetical protein
MVEHDRHRGRRDQILDRGNHRKTREQLHMPAARLDALDGGGKPRPADGGIIDAAGGEVEPDAADARLAHGVEIGFRRLVVDHGDAACGGPARGHSEQGGGIIGSVDARRDDHHAFHLQRLVQGGHLFGRRQFRRVDAPGEEREFRGVRVDVGVAVAGAGRNVEIHRRRRLRGFGKNGSAVHGYSGGDRGKHHTASCQHWCSPCDFCC